MAAAACGGLAGSVGSSARAANRKTPASSEQTSRIAAVSATRRPRCGPRVPRRAGQRRCARRRARHHHGLFRCDRWRRRAFGSRRGDANWGRSSGARAWAVACPSRSARRSPAYRSAALAHRRWAAGCSADRSAAPMAGEGSPCRRSTASIQPLASRRRRARRTRARGRRERQQIERDLRRGLVAKVSIFFQATIDDRCQPLRHVGRDVEQRAMRSLQHFGTSAVISRSSRNGNTPPESTSNITAAQTPQIGAMIDVPRRANLFRGNVVRPFPSCSRCAWPRGSTSENLPVRENFEIRNRRP